MAGACAQADRHLDGPHQALDEIGGDIDCSTAMLLVMPDPAVPDFTGEMTHIIKQSAMHEPGLL